VEDDADLIESIEGSGRSGVIGLPLDLVRELLTEAGVTS
jgi:predicted house-cleaning NTP pyrophosphatase (Maf/HAM1 superfamily)